MINTLIIVTFLLLIVILILSKPKPKPKLVHDNPEVVKPKSILKNDLNKTKIIDGRLQLKPVEYKKVRFDISE